MMRASRHTALSYILYANTIVAMLLVLVFYVLTVRNLHRDPKQAPVQPVPTKLESRFSRPTRPTFQPLAMEPFSIKDFKAYEFSNVGWKPLEMVGKEKARPTISNRVGRWKPRQYWKVGRLDRLDGFCGNRS